MIAALTTTVVGMGGPLGFPALRESLGLVPADSTGQADWGELRWVYVTSRIRASRSTESSVVGRLAPGDSVKADFPEAGWYAVFPTSASTRAEDTALGYVHADLLKSDRPPEVNLPLVRILP